ncbi:phosphatase PAP2 family protein [Kitasatospora sp. CM 4170]|uniref:Phosphatase PAP2 family protein n=1 Tax=Kitasatospora aburaviensis TaxID=67265 RepID=A0ABW1F5G0_9ACTN|nr:phosphatase PAP2 family protein [Kitasatospora sp. CM 4170]WNM49270.1 phosphatase PAP2 family protein [Kitasatospora sp. CM 4170]
MSPRRSHTTAAVMAGLFVVLAVVLATRGWAPFGFETRTLARSAAHRPPWARETAVVVTWFGTGVAPYVLALAAGAVLLGAVPRPWERRRTVVVVLAPLVWLGLGQLVRQGLMHGFGRPRPSGVYRAVSASGFSFPSGHTFTSAVCAGLIALAVARARPGLVRWVVACAAVFAAAIGVSRVYLGVHWPLDVLGGWLLGTAWLAVGALLLDRTLRWAAPRPLPDDDQAPGSPELPHRRVG